MGLEQSCHLEAKDLRSGKHSNPVSKDGCIAWNAHNTVFGSKRSAISVLAVYFLLSTRPSVT